MSACRTRPSWSCPSAATISPSSARNRKLLVFPIAQIPEMTRGKGVRLQRYKDGGISDVKFFAMADGLTWADSAGRTFTKTKDELVEWLGDRASAGRLVPKGFPTQRQILRLIARRQAIEPVDTRGRPFCLQPRCQMAQRPMSVAALPKMKCEITGPARLRYFRKSQPQTIPVSRATTASDAE